MINQIHKAVQLNEQLKKVRTRSGRINLTAINAMLLSRRAGKTALGFKIVSAELRRFSDDLDVSVEELTTEIRSMVSEGAALLKRNDIARLSEKVQGLSEKASEYYAKARSHHVERQRTIEHNLDLISGQIHSLLKNAFQKIERALFMYRNIRIEAAHGGELTAELTLVADEVENQLLEVHSIIKDLTKSA